MEQYDLLGLLVKRLESLGVRYFITGSVASMVYGEPRLTNDIDVVADIQPGHVAGLRALFPHPEFYLSEEAAREAIRLRSQFNILHPASGLKVDIIIPKRSDFDDSRFERVKRLRPLENVEANFSSPEDVIVKKLDFYREGGSEKHLRDIAGIIKYSGDTLDLGYINTWADRFRVRETWDKVLRASAPPR
jgi:hypothetical protein